MYDRPKMFDVCTRAACEARIANDRLDLVSTVPRPDTHALGPRWHQPHPGGCKVSIEICSAQLHQCKSKSTAL